MYENIRMVLTIYSASSKPKRSLIFLNTIGQYSFTLNLLGMLSLSEVKIWVVAWWICFIHSRGKVINHVNCCNYHSDTQSLGCDTNKKKRYVINKHCLAKMSNVMKTIHITQLCLPESCVFFCMYANTGQWNMQWWRILEWWKGR